VYFFFIPVFLNTMASRLSNWVDHDQIFGNRPDTDKEDNAHNVWWWAYLTFGEGWHYNHHKYPGNWKIGLDWWQFDPGRYVIQTLMFFGLAKEKNMCYN
jgi:stearoyl-CoA desaturase (delta-9 desaturase)